jgi:hypothetical protein
MKISIAKIENGNEINNESANEKWPIIYQMAIKMKERKEISAKAKVMKIINENNNGNQC